MGCEMMGWDGELIKEFITFIYGDQILYCIISDCYQKIKIYSTLYQSAIITIIHLSPQYNRIKNKQSLH